ncbi:MAG TPA: hypothetical protein VFF96_09675, partial [Pseudoxanthomonas sp.]|nr:hypothetical protein [Pseudoxanthomonas sp.]
MLLRGFILLLPLSLCACQRSPHASASRGAAMAGEGGQVTVGADEGDSAALNWRPPSLLLAETDIPAARRRAARALSQQRLFATADDAIPLYLAILAVKPDDAAARAGLDKSREALLKQGDAALRSVDSEADVLGESLREARQV